MNLLSIRRISLPAVLSVGVFACGGGGADPDKVQNGIEDDLPSLVENVLNSSEFLSDGQTLAAITDSLSGLESAFGDLPFANPDESDPLPPPDNEGEPVDSGEVSDQIVQFLIQEIFNDANYEGDGIYSLPPELFCSSGQDTVPVDPSTGQPIPDPTDNQECLDLFADLELKIKVEIAGDGLDFTLLVGPDKHSPIAVELRSDRLAVVVYFDEAKQAIEHVASVTGEQVDLPDTMEGVASATVIVNGPSHVTFELAIREDVEIDGNFPEVGHVRYTSEASDPSLSISLDGVNQRLSAAIDTKRTTLSMPWSAINADSFASGTFELDWQGFSASVTLEEGDQTLVIEDISIGDGQSTIKLDGSTLFALGLNQQSGGDFSLTIAPTDEQPSFTVAPEFDLSMAFDLSPLASAGDDVPDYLIDQTYRIQLNGSTPTVQPVEPPVDGEDGGLRVVSGTLTISSTAAASDVVVSAGECLIPDLLESGEHPVLGLLAAGPCP